MILEEEKQSKENKLFENSDSEYSEDEDSEQNISEDVKNVNSLLCNILHFKLTFYKKFLN